MKKIKKIFIFICVCFLIGCEKQKKENNDSSKVSVGATDKILEDDLTYIQKDAGNNKWFYYNGKYKGQFILDERTEYFELPQLNNNEKLIDMTISGVETLNLTKLNLYQTNKLVIRDCNLEKIIFGVDCENIKQITIHDCEFNSPNFLSHFPNVEYVLSGCKMEYIPNLDKNMKLIGIWIFSNTYEENKEMYEKIHQRYPSIIVEPMKDGEL